MDKQKIIDFLKVLCPVGKVEFNNLDKTFSFDEALQYKDNIYFLASVQDKMKRNWDKDIVFKNYFYVDFDLRENFKKAMNEVMSDEDMFIYLEFIKSELKNNERWDRRYIVFTGNWFHFYWVWNGNSYWVEDYKKTVERYYTDIDDIFNDPFLKVDHACKNIWRIARLPWTLNYGRQKKYWLEPREVEIIEDTGIMSEKIKDISVVAQLQTEKDIKEDIKRQIKDISDPTLEAILNLDIIPLVEEYTWLKIWKDKKNFPDDNGNTWMFVSDNILFWTGTARINDKFKWYNTFTFVKTHYNLDNNWTFQWFKNRYPQINDISEQKKKEFKKEITKTKVELDNLKEDIRIEKEKIDWKFWWYRPSRWNDYIDQEIRKMDDAWELIVLYWPPWCGKTELWFYIAKANRDIKTVYFCLEIPEDTILKRRALRKNWLSRKQIDYGTIEEYQQKNCIESINKFKEETKDYLKMISISDQPSIEQLIKKMEQQLSDKTIFIIDNLWKIIWDDDENKRFAQITAKLQTFAYNNKCRVLLQHHTIKPISQKKEKTIWDVFNQWLFWPYWFRGSQKIFDNATRMIEIHRDYELLKTQLLQYKHTPTDTRWYVELLFDKWNYRQYVEPIWE